MSDELANSSATGLGRAEEAAYELLIDRPASTLAELAALWLAPAHLPTVLARLEAAGLIITTPGQCTRYTAVDPDLALRALLAAREARLDQAQQRAEQIASAFRDAKARAEPESVVEVVTGRQAVRRRLGQLQRSALEEIRCLDMPPYLDQRATIAADLALLARGITCRTIYDRAAVGQRHVLPGIEQQIGAGQQARVLPDLPMKLYLVDRRFAFLPLQRDPDATESAMVVRPSALLDALATLFEGLWLRALPLRLPTDCDRAEPPHPPKGHDERLVALLLSGLTDETIARQLDLGYRTTQRRIATLMTELGAHTRFQAGVQAAFQVTRRQQPVTEPSPAPTDGEERVPPG